MVCISKTMGLKILIVTDFYYPFPGGISEHVHHLYEELKKLGHDVKILTTRYGKDDDKIKNPDVIRVGRFIPIPSIFANFSKGGIPYSWDMNKKIYEVINNGNFDIIHIQGLLPTLPLRALKYSNTKNVATTHISFKRNFWYLAFKKPSMPYFKKIHKLIAVSEEAKKCIEKFLPGDYKIIPNGIDLKRFNPEVKPFTQFDDKKNILFLGRFDPRKGLHILLKAFKILRQKRNDIRLMVVGRGKPPKLPEPYFLKINADRDEVPRFYRTADVYVSPALMGESFGIVLLEAMATGTPVIASDIPGYRCVIKDKENGLLFKTGDPHDLAQKIDLILEDEKLREKLINGGLNTAKKYSWDKIAKEVEKIYFELVEKKI